MKKCLILWVLYVKKQWFFYKKLYIKIRVSHKGLEIFYEILSFTTMQIKKLRRNMMKSTKTSREHITDILYYVLRIVTLFSVVLMFVPAINPARVCGMINKNLSLFSSGLFYGDLIGEMGRAFKKGWIDVSTMKLLYASSLGIILSTVSIAIGGCCSLGNIKGKKIGSLFSAIGAFVEMICLLGVYIAYTQLLLTEKPKKVEPMFPFGFWLFLIIALTVFVFSVAIMLLLPKMQKGMKFEISASYQLFLMFVPFLALIFVFSYLPLFGWRYAFFDYKVGDTLTMEKFVGFKWFSQLFQNAATVRDIVRVLKNTLAMSGLGIATSWFAMAFAMFLCEMKNLKYRRLVQVFTTIPNFISWVLVYAVAFCIFSTDGFVSSVMVNMGIWDQGTNMLMSGEHIWLKMLSWGLWKGLGWSAIIYIAAISGIDQQLYEAATVDGAGRFQRMWHITVPGLIPTFFVLLLMAVANILSNGMEQYYVFENAKNTDFIQVLDLYVYKLGIGKGSIPLTTVIGMVKSIVSVTLLFAANSVSKMIRGQSIV